MTFEDLLDIQQFLSTPSARRATCPAYAGHRPPEISIHALREEGDASIRKILPSSCRFLSTPSARRATISCAICAISLCQFLSTPSARRATQRPVPHAAAR